LPHPLLWRDCRAEMNTSQQAKENGGHHGRRHDTIA
jgi:hypothetical protein